MWRLPLRGPSRIEVIQAWRGQLAQARLTKTVRKSRSYFRQRRALHLHARAPASRLLFAMKRIAASRALFLNVTGRSFRHLPLGAYSSACFLLAPSLVGRRETTIERIYVEGRF